MEWPKNLPDEIKNILNLKSGSPILPTLKQLHVQLGEMLEKFEEIENAKKSSSPDTRQGRVEGDTGEES